MLSTVGEPTKISEVYPNASRLVESVGAIVGILRPHMGQMSELKLHDVLSPRHRQVIMQLAIAGSLSVSELAHKLQTSLASASQSVAHLAEGGFVARQEDPQDHRRTLVSLAGRTAELSRRLVDGRFGPLETALQNLEHQSVQAMLETLESLRSALEDAIANSPTSFCDTFARQDDPSESQSSPQSTTKES